MARDLDVNMAARRKLPKPLGNKAVTATSVTVLTLTSYIDQWIWLQAKTDTIYFGGYASASAATATTNSPFLPVNEHQEFLVTTDRQFLGLLGGGSATLIYGEVGD